MILVDTSVLIRHLSRRDADSEKLALFRRMLADEIPFAICPQVFQEVLQGARDERNFARLQTYLSTQRMLSLPQTAEACVKAARLFFDLRRKGVTVRGSADVLIALTAIENDAALLAEDRDFENIAAHEPRLRLA